MNKYFVFFLIFLLLLIIIDLIYNDEILVINQKLTLFLQNSGSNHVTNAFFISVSFTIQIPFVGLLIGYLYFSQPNKVEIFKQLIYLSFSSFCLTCLKLLYQDPRPYFLEEKIIPYGCEREFGKPSGHTMIGVIFYYILLRSIVNNYFEDFETSP